MAEQLVGRREELAAIDAFLGQDAAGGTALVVEGEAGIGKTSVSGDVVERARGRGYRMLTARPVAADVRLSFAGLGDLLGDVVDEALPSLPDPQRHALEAALLLALLGVLAAIGRSGRPSAPEGLPRAPRPAAPLARAPARPFVAGPRRGSCRGCAGRSGVRVVLPS